MVVQYGGDYPPLCAVDDRNDATPDSPVLLLVSAQSPDVPRQLPRRLVVRGRDPP